MLWAICSDIHGNLPALQVFLAYIEGVRSNMKILCLGDTVGYGAFPAECVALARDFDYHVSGNHERMLLNPDLRVLANHAACEAIEKTLPLLDEDSIAFLANLPSRVSLDERTLLIHGSPLNPDAYILNDNDARAALEYMENEGLKLCMIGHTHVPAIHTDSLERIRYHKGVFYLNPESRYLINCGSIGQPRDGNPRLSFCLFDTDKYSVEIVRLSYPIEPSIARIEEIGFPSVLGQRLSLGR